MAEWLAAGAFAVPIAIISWLLGAVMNKKCQICKTPYACEECRKRNRLKAVVGK